MIDASRFSSNAWLTRNSLGVMVVLSAMTITSTAQLLDFLQNVVISGRVPYPFWRTTDPPSTMWENLLASYTYTMTYSSQPRELTCCRLRGGLLGTVWADDH